MKPTFHLDRYPDQGYAQVQPDAHGVAFQHVLLMNGGDLVMDEAGDFADQINLGLRVIEAAQPLFAQVGPSTVMLRGIKLSRTAPPILYFEVLIAVHHGIEFNDQAIITQAHAALDTGQPLDFRCRATIRDPQNENMPPHNEQLFRNGNVGQAMRDMGWQV